MEYKRDFIKIANRIIDVIKEKSDLDLEKKNDIISRIEMIKNEGRYRAPELSYINWNELGKLLSFYFNPKNSKWEMEILVIFNDLKGTVDDYWEGEK